MEETKITIEAVYLDLDAISQVVGLSRTPQALKPKLRRLYVNVNLHLFKIANLTGQKKEDIVLWIEGASNPADKLGKFDIDKHTVEKWISLANQVLVPNWLQQHPCKYLDKLIHTSKERIKSILQGGGAEDESSQGSVDEATIRHISCYEGYTPKHPMQGKGCDTARLQGLINRNKHKGSAYCMKIMGLATYAAHKWRDRVFLKKTSV